MSGECRDTEEHGPCRCRGLRCAHLQEVRRCEQAGHHRVRDLWQRAARTRGGFSRVARSQSSSRCRSRSRTSASASRERGSLFRSGGRGALDEAPACHISTPEQWTRVREIVDRDFGRGSAGGASRIASPSQGPLSESASCRSSSARPGIAREVLGDSADGATEKEKSSPDGSRSSTGSGVTKQSSAVHSCGVPGPPRRLPAEGGEALTQLERLLESWSLHQITQLVSQIRQRLRRSRSLKSSSSTTGPTSSKGSARSTRP